MWSVYLLECYDKSHYCGVSNNFTDRLTAHNKGRGAKYTRSRLPVSLIIKVDGFTKSEAMKLEYKVKKQPRKNKIYFLKQHKTKKLNERNQ